VAATVYCSLKYGYHIVTAAVLDGGDVFVCLSIVFGFLSLFSDGITGTSLGARMLQGGVKRGLLLRNMQVE